jgi:hypothetical protein
MQLEFNIKYLLYYQHSLMMGIYYLLQDGAAMSRSRDQTRWPHPEAEDEDGGAPPKVSARHFYCERSFCAVLNTLFDITRAHDNRKREYCPCCIVLTKNSSWMLALCLALVSLLPDHVVMIYWSSHLLHTSSCWWRTLSLLVSILANTAAKFERSFF